MVIDVTNKKHPSLLVDFLSTEKFKKSKIEKVLIVNSFKLDIHLLLNVCCRSNTYTG